MAHWNRHKGVLDEKEFNKIRLMKSDLNLTQKQIAEILGWARLTIYRVCKVKNWAEYLDYKESIKARFKNKIQEPVATPVEGKKPQEMEESATLAIVSIARSFEELNRNMEKLISAWERAPQMPDFH